MIELIEEAEYKDKWFEMTDMRPLQVCVTDLEQVVMRTASISQFEVMDLSTPAEDGCWGGMVSVKVRALRPGETYTLKLS